MGPRLSSGMDASGLQCCPRHHLRRWENEGDFLVSCCVEVGAWKDVGIAMGKLVRQWLIAWVLQGLGVEISVEVWEW